MIQNKENKKPKISINKLAEYSVTNPGRRRTIVKNAKFPKPVIVARNNDFFSSIKAATINGSIDLDIIRGSLDEMHSRIENRKWHAENIQINTLLLQSLIEVVKLNELDAVSVTDSLYQLHTQISGVDVNVRPDLMIELVKRGKKLRGCIKFHTSKCNPITRKSGEYIATILKQSIEQIESVTPVCGDFCLVIDLPTKSIFSAPKAHIKRWKDIEAACKEIYSVWQDVEY